MEVAIWIIAVCEVIRALQNHIQLSMVRRDSSSRENAYSEFVKSLKQDDRQFVERVLQEFKEQHENEAEWVHREDMDFGDKYGVNHFHGMCKDCGFIHDFIDCHTGQYKYCPSCGGKIVWIEKEL